MGIIRWNIKQIFAYACGIVGSIIVVGLRVYHFVNSDWSEIQAFRLLWMWYLLGLVFLLTAFWLFESLRRQRDSLEES